MDFGPEGMEKKKAWKDIWGCGQGINAVKDMVRSGSFSKIAIEAEGRNVLEF